MLNTSSLLTDQVTMFWTKLTFIFVGILFVFLVVCFFITILFRFKYLKVYNEMVVKDASN